MLYVLILYCTGFCPSELIGPPSNVLFFSSYADCQAHIKNHPALQFEPSHLPGSSIATALKETCSRVFSDPAQLDRILKPDQLAKALAVYKAHGDGYKPWIPKGCEGKATCTASDMIGPCGKGMDFGCLFKDKDALAPKCDLAAGMCLSTQDNRTSIANPDVLPPGIPISTSIPCVNSNGEPSVIVYQSLPSKPTYP